MSKKLEEQIYDSLCYPGDEPRTLINKLGIRDLIGLEIERKLRSQFRDDPAAVEHGLNTARLKIADMIAHGLEIKAPKIIDALNKNRDR